MYHKISAISFGLYLMVWMSMEILEAITNIETLELQLIQLGDQLTTCMIYHPVVNFGPPIPGRVDQSTDLPFPFNRGACSSISETEALLCAGSGEDGYGRDCWKFDGVKYTQTNGTKYGRDCQSPFLSINIHFTAN